MDTSIRKVCQFVTHPIASCPVTLICLLPGQDPDLLLIDWRRFFSEIARGHLGRAANLLMIGRDELKPVLKRSDLRVDEQMNPEPIAPVEDELAPMEKMRKYGTKKLKSAAIQLFSCSARDPAQSGDFLFRLSIRGHRACQDRCWIAGFQREIAVPLTGQERVQPVQGRIGHHLIIEDGRFEVDSYGHS